jgi:hypothetical protein
MPPKSNGLDNIHDNNLKECLNKEVKAKKEVRKEQNKAKIVVKQIKDWVIKYAAKGKFINYFLKSILINIVVSTTRFLRLTKKPTYKFGVSINMF